MKRKRREEKRRKQELAAQLGTEPRVDVEPKPVWEDYRPPAPAWSDDFDQNEFYGPLPDSPEGIQAARVLNKKTTAELTEAVRQTGPTYSASYASVASPPQFDPELAKLHRNYRIEPPRMYCVRRMLTDRADRASGLTELLTPEGTWTRELLAAKVAQAHQFKCPEDDNPWVYDIVPFDYLVWVTQQERLDEDCVAALL